MKIRYFVYMLIFLVLCAAAQADNNDVAFFRSIILMCSWSVYFLFKTLGDDKYENMER